MLIAAWAIEAEDAYIYLRDEYPSIRQLLLEEIRALDTAGLSNGVNIHLRRGAGAYICGEESALLESIEGKRGLPRNRPPYPAEKGLFGKPTLINNVETLHWVSEILQHGSDWYLEEGRPRFYSVSGRVKNPGIVLAPSGVTALDLINNFCGGMLDGHHLKAYLPGGASGGILPASMADIPLDFGTLEEFGCFVGSAAVVVFSNHDKIPAVALNLIEFFAEESCGQCTPCRLGCEKMIKLIKNGSTDETLIDDLIMVMQDASICGLGQAAPNPIASGLKHFKGEFNEQ
jgi:formate dehydrogenase